MINYSIIVPHKNTPKLLERLLASISNREDTEIIIVDDNSDPNIVDYNTFPGSQRADVQIIFSKETGGAGHARNVGLSFAKGKWLLFADADDFYNADALDRLRNKYLDNQSTEIVYLNAKMVDENGAYVGDTFITPYIHNYLKNRPLAEKVLRYGVWEPWNRMVRRECVVKNKIVFDEIPVGNDQMFSLKCSRYCSKMAVEEEIVYNYFKPSGRSNTAKYRRNLNLLPSYIDLKMRVNAFYDEVGYPFKTSFVKILIKASDGGPEKTAYRKKMYQCLKKSKLNPIKDICYMIRNQIASFLKIR